MKNKVISKQPATCWQDALPLGNGRFAALVEGGIVKDVISFNVENLYLPLDKESEPIYAADALKEVQKLLLEEQYVEAFALMQKAFYRKNQIMPYQPLGELCISMFHEGIKRHYTRTLDMEKAEVSVSWEADDVQYRRRQFVSRADDSFVMSVSNDHDLPMDITLNLREKSGRRKRNNEDGPSAAQYEAAFTTEYCAADQRLSFLATYQNGQQFGMNMVFETDGEIAYAQSSAEVSISNFTRLTLVCRGYAFEAARVAQICGYEEAFDRHYKLYRELYQKVRFELESGDTTRSTEELLLEAGYETSSKELMELMFNYSRYLFIGSVVGGKYPANLQGIWNGSYTPIWEADMHNDENVEMCHWQSLPGGLPGGIEACMDYFMERMDQFRANARYSMGCRGILIPVCMSVHGHYSESGGEFAWVSAAGWLAQSFYDYYLYTHDRKMLEDRIVPFMEEYILFIRDFCTEIDGKLHFIPSHSPENWPGGTTFSNSITIDATMDVAIAREVITNLKEAYTLLGKDSTKLDELYAKLPAYQINSDGAMREWLWKDLPDNYAHRHMSHLYPLFPGYEVNCETNRETFEAIRVAAHKRLENGSTSQTGWSFVHLAHVFARLNEGDQAYTCLDLLMRAAVGPNLFTYHNDWRYLGLTFELDVYKPFQIDANLGFASAVMEMLVYSSKDFLHLLPALPSSWQRGSIQGISLRMYGTVDVEWDEEQMTATVLLYEDKTIRIRCEDTPSKECFLKGKEPYRLTYDRKNKNWQFAGI